MLRLIALLSCCLALAACGDPMDKVERLSDVDIPADAPRIGVLAPEGAPGILTEARAAAAAEQGAETTDQPAAERPARGGLFGLFSGRRATAAATPEDSTTDAPAAPEAAGTDDGDAAVVETAAAQSAPRRGGFLGGLFSGGGASRGGSGGEVEVEPGTVLPFGQVARVCGVSRRDLGREVGRNASFRLHDSDPASTRPHTFYITGFDDNCARQVTGALGMFGDVSMHETLRYGASGAAMPWSATDTAYETVKRQVCGVGRNKPCGARINRMQRDTVFLTVYERFGDGSRWANLLLHDGAVLAHDVEG